MAQSSAGLALGSGAGICRGPARRDAERARMPTHWSPAPACRTSASATPAACTATGPAWRSAPTSDWCPACRERTLACAWAAAAPKASRTRYATCASSPSFSWGWLTTTERYAPRPQARLACPRVRHGRRLSRIITLLPKRELLMNDVQQRIDDLVKTNRVVLFMKGTSQFPMCGFSGRAIQILKASGVTRPEDLQRAGRRAKCARASRNTPTGRPSPALRQRRIRRRLGHHDGDVRVG